MTLSKRLAALLVASSALAGTAGYALADGTLKVGTLATLEGPFTVLGEDGMRGVELAIMQHKGMAGGMKIELDKGSTDASPDSAVSFWHRVKPRHMTSAMSFAFEKFEFENFARSKNFTREICRSTTLSILLDADQSPHGTQKRGHEGWGPLSPETRFTSPASIPWLG